MPEQPVGDMPTIETLVAEARETFASQLAKAPSPIVRYAVDLGAAFNNAISPLVMALETSTAALFDTANDNMRRGAENERLAAKVNSVQRAARTVYTDLQDERDELLANSEVTAHRLEVVRAMYEPLVVRVRGRVVCPFCEVPQLGIEKPTHGLTCPMHRIDNPK